MNSQEDRKQVIGTLNRVQSRLRVERASLTAQELNVKQLEELTTRPGFLKRSDDKRQRFIKKLAEARQHLRSKATEISNIEAEIQRLNAKLAG